MGIGNLKYGVCVEGGGRSAGSKSQGHFKHREVNGTTEVVLGRRASRIETRRRLLFEVAGRGREEKDASLKARGRWGGVGYWSSFDSSCFPGKVLRSRSFACGKMKVPVRRLNKRWKKNENHSEGFEKNKNPPKTPNPKHEPRPKQTTPPRQTKKANQLQNLQLRGKVGTKESTSHPPFKGKKKEFENTR